LAVRIIDYLQGTILNMDMNSPVVGFQDDVFEI